MPPLLSRSQRRKPADKCDGICLFRNKSWIKGLSTMTPKPAVNRPTLHDIFEEVRKTIEVHLTDEGVAALRETPYVREGGCLNCRRIINSRATNYLDLEVRYYRDHSKLPEYAFLAIPHGFVRYMVAETDFNTAPAAAKSAHRRKKTA
jgi:hypothetical protein